MINAQITMTHPVSLGQPSHSSPRKRQGPVPGGLHGRPRPGTVPEPEDTPRKAPGIHLTPEEKREEQLQRKKEQLTQRQKQVNKNLKRIKLQSISNGIRRIASIIKKAEETIKWEEIPSELNDIMRKMKIRSGNTGEINKLEGMNSTIYEFRMNRIWVFSDDELDKIKSKPEFNAIKYDTAGPVVVLEVKKPFGQIREEKKKLRTGP